MLMLIYANSISDSIIKFLSSKNKFFIKLLEPGAPILQFAFLRCLITLAFLVPVARKIDRNNLFSGFRVHALRAHIHLAGLLFMIVALSNLPLATANAVFYVAPIMVMVLSVLFFRESLNGKVATYSLTLLRLK